jgi:hypothetical protein
MSNPTIRPCLFGRDLSRWGSALTGVGLARVRADQPAMSNERRLSGCSVMRLTTTECARALSLARTRGSDSDAAVRVDEAGDDGTPVAGPAQALGPGCEEAPRTRGGVRFAVSASAAIKLVRGCARLDTHGTGPDRWLPQATTAGQEEFLGN